MRQCGYRRNNAMFCWLTFAQNVCYLLWAAKEYVYAEEKTKFNWVLCWDGTFRLKVRELEGIWTSNKLINVLSQRFSLVFSFSDRSFHLRMASFQQLGLPTHVSHTSISFGWFAQQIYTLSFRLDLLTRIYSNFIWISSMLHVHTVCKTFTMGRNLTETSLCIIKRSRDHQW